MASKRSRRRAQDNVVRPEDHQVSSEDDEDQEDHEAWPENSEEENPRKKKSPTIGLRCSPRYVGEAALLLEEDTKKVLQDYGFGDILHVNVTRCFSVERILLWISKCDVSSQDESFTVVFSEENKIKVTPEKVKHVFGIPDGTPDGDPVMNNKHWGRKWEDFWQLLKDKGYKVERTVVKENGEPTVKKEISVETVKEYIKSVKHDKHEQARAFLCIVLFKLLLPAQSNYILSKHVGMCSDLDWMKKFNWCRYVCQDMKNKITTYQRKMPKSKIDGCMLLLMMCFIETIPQLQPVQPSVKTLIRLYDDKKVENLLGGLKDIREIRRAVSKYQPQPKPASKKQQVRTIQVRRQKGKQVTEQIGFLSVEDLLKECEVDEDDRGVLLRILNRRIEYGEARVKQKLEKIRDKTNEDLKVIVADHSKWSRLYNEIKYKAQIKDKNIKRWDQEKMNPTA